MMRIFSEAPTLWPGYELFKSNYHKKLKSRPWINNIQTIKENKEPSRKDSIFVQEPGIAGGHLPVHAHF